MQYHKLKNTEVEVTVKTSGAELCSVVDLSSGVEYIWQADPAIWARHAPVLFPIVGKLKDNTFTFNGSTYNLAQHGFARDREFICIEATDTKLVFELTANEESLLHFPFHFSLQISYELHANTLDVVYHVFNPDNGKLYFSVGAHPAFNCPLLEGEIVEDYKLYFPGLDALVINTLNDGLIADETITLRLENHALPVSRELFNNDALVMMNHQIDAVILQSEKTGRGVSLTSKGWPYFGIWTKKQTAQFICLEPWYGIADHVNTNKAFEQKTGIMCLEPLQNFSCNYQIGFLK